MRGAVIGLFSALGVRFVAPSLGLWQAIAATTCFVLVGVAAASDSP